MEEGTLELVRDPDKAIVQLNDTHPTITIPELLMRLLMDDEELGWDEALDATIRSVYRRCCFM